MSKILIIYSTTDGHTIKICERIKNILTKKHTVDILSVEKSDKNKLNPYDKIILGASIRYGKHSKEITSFIENNKDILDKKDNAFFSVNLVARKPEKCSPTTNPYVKKFLTSITWQPRQCAVFAGKINYPSYSFFDRLVIQLIMWMTHGPTHPKTIKEYTNWETVDAFAEGFN